MNCVYVWPAKLHEIIVREAHLQISVNDSQAMAVGHTVQDLLNAVAEQT